MPTHRYDIIENGQIVATFYTMLEACDYCENLEDATIKITKL